MDEAVADNHIFADEALEAHLGAPQFGRPSQNTSTCADSPGSLREAIHWCVRVKPSTVPDDHEPVVITFTGLNSGKEEIEPVPFVAANCT
ncbi:MAG: hypothetical protein ACFCBV_13095 [Phycisphaerales bacterium]